MVIKKLQLLVIIIQININKNKILIYNLKFYNNYSTFKYNIIIFKI